MHVEQAFGQLVGRWRILKSPLGFRMETCTQVIVAAILLHNFCKDYDRKQVIPTSNENSEEGQQRLDVWLMWCQKNVDLHATLGSTVMGENRGGLRRALQRSRCRRRLILTLQRQGILKPPWASLEDFVRNQDDDDGLDDIDGHRD